MRDAKHFCANDHVPSEAKTLSRPAMRGRKHTGLSRGEEAGDMPPPPSRLRTYAH
jgi:hypothetical protein